MALKPNDRPFVVNKPNCYVVSKQVMDNKTFAKFLCDEGHKGWTTDAETDQEKIIEVAGRLCYMSFDGGRPWDEYIVNVLDSGHGSVLEHAVFNLILTGVSRSFTHELVRHRAGMGYSQLSERFVNMGPGQVVCPSDILRFKDDPNYSHIYEYWVKNCEAQFAAYKYLQDALHNALASPDGQKVSAEDATKARTMHRKRVNGTARSILPEATEAKIFVTANARALRHFIGLRGTAEADPEIRRVAISILEGVYPLAPGVFEDLEFYQHEEAGTCVRAKYVKV